MAFLPLLGPQAEDYMEAVVADTISGMVEKFRAYKAAATARFARDSQRLLDGELARLWDQPGGSFDVYCPIEDQKLEVVLPPDVGCRVFRSRAKVNHVRVQWWRTPPV